MAAASFTSIPAWERPGHPGLEFDSRGGEPKKKKKSEMLPSLRFQRLVPVAVLVLVCFFLLSSRLRETPDPALGALDGAISRTEGASDAHSQAQTPAPPSTPTTPETKSDDVVAKPAPSQCASEIERLRAFGVSSQFVYYRRCVKPKHTSDAPRDVVSKIQKPLLEKGAHINLDTCTHDDLPPCSPLTLAVPPKNPTKKYPHLLFGISTMYKRLEESLPAFETWLGGSESPMVAVVVDAEPENEAPKDFKAIEAMYLKAGIKLTCVKPRNSTLSVDQNHFTVIEDLVEAATPGIKWIGLLDDDTFFPSLYNLDQELAKYDYKKSVWLGALSEDLEAIRNWGVMAFGGAGVFLSVPLARELTPRIPDCINNARRNTGDAILRDCIFDETHTKLTTVTGLYQHDLRGDVSGFYESGVRPLSLHHWKSWYHAPVDKMASVVNVCGDCFLQRWRFGDDTLFANGYSITQYSAIEGGLDNLDLERTETTWVTSRNDFDWSLGPLRERLADGKKKSYLLVDIKQTDTNLTQFYVFKGKKENQEIDELVEIIWES